MMTLKMVHLKGVEYLKPVERQRREQKALMPRLASEVKYIHVLSYPSYFLPSEREASWARGQLGLIMRVPGKHRDFGSIPRMPVGKKKSQVWCYLLVILELEWQRQEEPGIGWPASQ